MLPLGSPDRIHVAFDDHRVKDGEKMYRVGGPIADSGVVVQRFCQFKWKATLSV